MIFSLYPLSIFGPPHPKKISQCSCKIDNLIYQAGGEHLVFLGDGHDQSSDVDSNMMMAVARFLQKHTKFISILLGGYPSFHQETTPTTKTQSDQETTEEVSDASPNKLNSIKSSLKQKSVNLKDSLINYIYNPNNQPPPEPKHIDYTKRGSKLYKNAGDVFSLEVINVFHF